MSNDCFAECSSATYLLKCLLLRENNKYFIPPDIMKRKTTTITVRRTEDLLHNFGLTHSNKGEDMEESLHISSLSGAKNFTRELYYVAISIHFSLMNPINNYLSFHICNLFSFKINIWNPIVVIKLLNHGQGVEKVQECKLSTASNL